MAPMPLDASENITRDVDNLLTTNRTSREELQRQANEKLDALNKRISELEAQLESAKRERTALLQNPLPYQRPLAPFLRLPENVIRRIFVACLDPEINPTMSKKEAPTLLTQISSDLRRIAIAAPELWAAIHIPIIELVTPNTSDLARFVMDKRAAGVKEWLLRRSRNLPLRISVRRAAQNFHWFSDSDLPVHLPNDIMDVVLSCCLRWRDIFLSASSSRNSLFPWFTELRPEDVPLLQSFYYSDRTGDYDPISWTNCRFLASSNLRRFCTNTNTNHTLALLPPIRWENLTHLGLLGSPPVDNKCIALCNMLRQCPRLISLKLHCHSRGSPSTGRIVMPTLKFLTIEEYRAYNTSTTVPGFLAAIFAPALTALVYNVDYKPVGKPDPRPDNLLAILRRAPNLTQLTLGDCHSTDILLECVQHCPLLSYLKLDNFEISLNRQLVAGTNESHDLILSRLFLDDDCLCSRLDHFHCLDFFAISLETYRKIIHRKSGAIPHLAQWKALKLRISYYDPPDYSAIEKLRAEVMANNRNQIDIDFNHVFRIPYDLVHPIGYHIQPAYRGDTWSVRDTWPLGE